MKITADIKFPDFYRNGYRTGSRWIHSWVPGGPHRMNVSPADSEEYRKKAEDSQLQHRDYMQGFHDGRNAAAKRAESATSKTTKEGIAMNKEQRKTLEQLVADIESAKELIEQYKETAETEQEAEQEKYDNLPEGLQQGEKGQAHDTASNALSEAVSSLESAADSLDQALSSINEAMEA